VLTLASSGMSVVETAGVGGPGTTLGSWPPTPSAAKTSHWWTPGASPSPPTSTTT
jgi:hypothetical protein